MHLADIAKAGLLPLQDHREEWDLGTLPMRAARYAGRVIERDQYGGWLFEEDTLGDVVCATMLDVDSGQRAVPGWAYAWPMLTSPAGSVTTGGGQFSIGIFEGTKGAMAASASMVKPGVPSSPVAPTEGRSKIGSGRQFGTVGRPGGGSGGNGASGDFSSWRGWTNTYFGEVGQVGARIGIGGMFPSYGGDFSWSRSGGGAAAGTGGGSGGGKSGVGGGAGGPRGEIGSAGSSFQRPDVKVPLRPIYAEDFNADARFKQRVVVMDGSFPDFHKGALGITISGVKEGRQDPLYLPTDPRLIAVEYGAKASAASMVCDLNGEGMVDPLRTARLHSLTRVVKGPGGGVIAFGDNVLALNYGRAGGDGVPGYGAIIDQGDKVIPVRSTTPGASKTADGEGVTGGVAPNVAVKTQYGGAAVGLMSGPQASGPIDVGADKNDPHQFGQDQDGHSIQSAHVSTNAYHRVPSTDFDGPLEFKLSNFPQILPGSYHAQVDCLFDRSKMHEWKGGQKPGKWRWVAFTVMSSGGGKPPERPPVTTPRSPPPRTPAPPAPKPPPPTTPGGGFPPSGISLSPGRAGAILPSPLGSPADAAWWPGRGPIEAPAPVGLPTYAAPSNTTARPREREDGPDREARTHLQMAVPSILARALTTNRAHGAPRGADYWTPEEAARFHALAPTVGRIDAFGAQYASGSWVYNQRPGASRYQGGTGSGGWLILPPERSLEDVGTSYSRTSVAASTTYFAAGPGVYFAAGLPITTSGGMKSGYRWGLSGSDLVFQHLDSSGTPTTVAKLGSTKVFSFMESGGPTLLSVGAIPALTILNRTNGTDAVVGSTLVDLGAAEVLDRVTAHTDVTNTAAETTLYTKQIAGGTLSTNRAVRLTIDGDVLQNATLTFTVKVKFGATTIYDSGASTLANSANRHAMRMQIDLYADGATNAQDVGGWVSIGSTVAAATGTSALAAGGSLPAVICGAGAAEDSTANKVFVVTITWSSNSVNASFRLKHATLERL